MVPLQADWGDEGDWGEGNWDENAAGDWV